MFRQIIFVILTRTFIYALHTYSSHTALVARHSVEGKYNIAMLINAGIEEIDLLYSCVQ